MRDCVQCGHQFEPVRDVHFFCSDQCRKAARGTEYRKQRALALMRDSHSCTECDATDLLECHHKLPLCYGGDHSLGNLQTLCRKCHKANHKRWKEWRIYGREGDSKAEREIYDHAA
jgi:5-methylcytosine-specific restriction endonuclease McrA